MVALHEDTPSEHRLVNDMKREGTFDELRKTYFSILTEDKSFQDFKGTHDFEVDKFLKQRTWKPSLKKEETRKALRNYIRQTHLMRGIMPRLIKDVIDEHLNDHIVPKVQEYAKAILSKREEEKTEEVDSKPKEDEERLPHVPRKIDENDEKIRNSKIAAEYQTHPDPHPATERDTQEEEDVDLEQLTLEDRLKFIMEKGMGGPEQEEAENSPDQSPIHGEESDAPGSSGAGGLASLLSKLKSSNILKKIATDPKAEDGLDSGTTPRSTPDRGSEDDGGATPLDDEIDEDETVGKNTGSIPIVPIVRIGGTGTTQKTEESSTSESDSSSGDSDSSSSDSDHHRRAKVRPSKAFLEKREARRRASNTEITRVTDSRRRRNSDHSSPSPHTRPPRGSPTYGDYRPDEPSRSRKASGDRRRSKEKPLWKDGDKEKPLWRETDRKRRNRDSSSSDSSSDSREDSRRSYPKRSYRASENRDDSRGISYHDSRSYHDRGYHDRSSFHRSFDGFRHREHSRKIRHSFRNRKSPSRKKRSPALRRTFLPFLTLGARGRENRAAVFPPHNPQITTKGFVQNIHQPANPVYDDLVRRHNETLTEYQLRVHNEFLDRHKRHLTLDAPASDDEKLFAKIMAPGPDRRGPPGHWNHGRQFVSYHHQTMSIRHHKPSFDITQELAKTAEKASLSRVDDSSSSKKFQKSPDDQSPEEGEVSD